MSTAAAMDREPSISVGLLDRSPSATIRLEGSFCTPEGRRVGPGVLTATGRGSAIHCAGAVQGTFTELHLMPEHPGRDQFSLETTIGIDFHWQQAETESFRGALRLLPPSEGRFAVVNHVPLETYLTAVVCSEMKATSPREFVKAHAVISRSWLLAQLDTRRTAAVRPAPAADPQATNDAIIRWTDREAHDDFDVCADDHCQRYQGLGRVNHPDVEGAVAETWGEVLCYQGHVCDARFSKCCGGVTEEFATAWSDRTVPYLIARWDGPEPLGSLPRLQEEPSFRRFLAEPPAAFCHCDDRELLGRILNDYDLSTVEFFRWRVRLSAQAAAELIQRKLGRDLGRVIDLQPLQRGPSGRILRLRIVGEDGSLIIGKELEVRRVLSESHLYSSAFVVDREGPAARPQAFVLTGAGWGHGVGLCQIGAAVMAHRGYDYREILQHYYPGAHVKRYYA